MPDWVTLVISGAAVVIASISLWRSHLAPFCPTLLSGPLAFRLDRIEPSFSGGNHLWWIPTVDLTLTIANEGAKAGRIHDVQLVFTDAQCPENDMVFEANWIVDYAKFLPNIGQRSEWIRSAILWEWCPMLVGPKETKTMHVVFQAHRWDILTEGMHANYTIELKAFSDAHPDGFVYERYHLPLAYDLLNSLAQHAGETVSVYPACMHFARHE
jgi:hypothetical protein